MFQIQLTILKWKLLLLLKYHMSMEKWEGGVGYMLKLYVAYLQC